MKILDKLLIKIESAQWKLSKLIKKLEIFKILFLSLVEDKNFVDHHEQNFTRKNK